MNINTGVTIAPTFDEPICPKAALLSPYDMALYLRSCHRFDNDWLTRFGPRPPRLDRQYKIRWKEWRRHGLLHCREVPHLISIFAREVTRILHQKHLPRATLLRRSILAAAHRRL